MFGTYILLLKLSEPTRIIIGRLGELSFESGYYIYIGSAINGLRSRLDRHKGGRKKLFWHIDYLLTKAKILEIYYKCGSKKDECITANNFLTEFKLIKKFGSSDCHCPSHLFYHQNKQTLKENILALSYSIYP